MLQLSEHPAIRQRDPLDKHSHSQTYSTGSVSTGLPSPRHSPPMTASSRLTDNPVQVRYLPYNEKPHQPHTLDLDNLLVSSFTGQSSPTGTSPTDNPKFHEFSSTNGPNSTKAGAHSPHRRSPRILAGNGFTSNKIKPESEPKADSLPNTSSLDTLSQDPRDGEVPLPITTTTTTATVTPLPYDLEAQDTESSPLLSVPASGRKVSTPQGQHFRDHVITVPTYPAESQILPLVSGTPTRVFYKEGEERQPSPEGNAGIIVLGGPRIHALPPSPPIPLRDALDRPTSLVGSNASPSPPNQPKTSTFANHRAISNDPGMEIILHRNNTTAGEQIVLRKRPEHTVSGEYSLPANILRRNTYAPGSVPASGHANGGPTLEPPENEIDWLTAKQDMKRKRRVSRRRRDLEPESPNVAIGTRIDEHHVNFVLMYNMLTGIRVAVSRCTGKPQRPLSSVDFRASNKVAFDLMGDELTPSSKYDFKFKDYAPWVFRHIREAFRLDSADYLMSLTSKYILSEVGSAGKSGSFFYYSQDYRFIIKTIHHTEHRFMRRILPHYYEHIRKNPHTLVVRIYGLHRVKLPHSRKIHFVVMNNVFPPNKDIHETFDLKGSTYGRYLNEEAQKKPRAVLKDLNWMQMGRKLELGPVKRNLFVEQLERDAALLQRLRIMDYSLLIGIHDRSRGNRDNIRDNTLSVFNPNVPNDLEAMRKAIVESDPVSLDESGALLPEKTFPELRSCLFYQDSGGFRSTDESDRSTNLIYYMGVIDILTLYNASKRIEHLAKSVVQDPRTISAVHPRVYAQRFFDFVINGLKHHEDIPPIKVGEWKHPSPSPQLTSGYVLPNNAQHPKSQ